MSWPRSNQEQETVYCRTCKTSYSVSSLRQQDGVSNAGDNARITKFIDHRGHTLKVIPANHALHQEFDVNDLKGIP